MAEQKYYASADGTELVSGFGVQPGPDMVEIDEAQYVAYETANAEALQQRITASREEAATESLAEAQAAYDEIVGIHPVAALALAKLIYPRFTAPKKKGK